MAANAEPIYELVSGQIMLGMREEFLALHRDVLLPLMSEAGIQPLLCMIIEIGRNGRFIDVYRYPSWGEYESRTAVLLDNPELAAYYRRISACITGSITVELARSFPHTNGQES